MIAHSMYQPITAVVMPLLWCVVCEAHRPAAGAPGLGWRCQACGELHDDTATGHQPTTRLETGEEVPA